MAMDWGSFIARLWFKVFPSGLCGHIQYITLPNLMRLRIARIGPMSDGTDSEIETEDRTPAVVHLAVYGQPMGFVRMHEVAPDGSALPDDAARWSVSCRFTANYPPTPRVVHLRRRYATRDSLWDEAPCLGHLVIEARRIRRSMPRWLRGVDKAVRTGTFWVKNMAEAAIPNRVTQQALANYLRGVKAREPVKVTFPSPPAPPASPVPPASTLPERCTEPVLNFMLYLHRKGEVRLHQVDADGNAFPAGAKIITIWSRAYRGLRRVEPYQVLWNPEAPASADPEAPVSVANWLAAGFVRLGPIAFKQVNYITEARTWFSRVGRALLRGELTTRATSRLPDNVLIMWQLVDALRQLHHQPPIRVMGKRQGTAPAPTLPFDPLPELLLGPDLKVFYPPEPDRTAKATSAPRPPPSAATIQRLARVTAATPYRIYLHPDGSARAIGPASNSTNLADAP